MQRRNPFCLVSVLAVVVVVVVALALAAGRGPSPAFSQGGTPTPPSATTFTVNSHGDGDDEDLNDPACDDGTGHCTLRAAIQQANQHVGADTINFSIETGYGWVVLTSALPTITDPVTIDGGTQEAGDIGWVELNGDGTSGADGLHITAGDSTVRRLLIVDFDGDGIVLEGGGGNVIRSNFIGPDHHADRGNGGYGVRITNSPNNTIGVPYQQSNIISKNGAGGILIEGAAATGNRVQANAIGVLHDLVTPIGNGGHGVTVTGAANTTIVDNIISTNSGSGVYISGAGATGNLLRGNIIGADGGGTLDRGNSQDGVHIYGAPNNSVGVPSPTLETGNLISGNDRAGVHISGAGAEGNQVQHNAIGVQLDRASPLGNGSHGVWIEGSNNNLVGGPASEPPATIPPSTWVVPDTLNIIANNGGAGVFVDGSGNSIRANNIYDNASLGIEVPPGGPSLPWTESALTSALWSPQWFCVDEDENTFCEGAEWKYGPMVVATGYVYGGLPNTNVVVEGFVSPARDPSEYGEGKEWRAGGDPPQFRFDAAGQMSVAGGFPSDNVVGQYLTTTVTNSDGTTTEFGKCALIKPDTDGDNIANEVDTVLGAPGERSHEFSDEGLGGTTTGTLISDGPSGRNGCFVAVADMPSPNGVVIGATCLPKAGGGYKGPAHLEVCEGAKKKPLDIYHAASTFVKCGSAEFSVGYGPVSVGVGTMTARLPTGAETAIGDPVDGNYEVVNGSTSPTIWVGGLLIDPDTTVTVHDADGDAMADGYETAHSCLNPSLNDAGADPDWDTVTNLQEAELGTDPCSFDGPVGGMAELPPIAGIDGWPAHNYAIAAALAFVAVVALTAGAWYARRRFSRS